MDAAKFDDFKENAIMKQISREFMQRDLDKAFAAFRDTVVIPSSPFHGDSLACT